MSQQVDLIQLKKCITKNYEAKEIQRLNNETISILNGMAFNN